VKTSLDCIPCFFSQVLRAARMATDDERLVYQLLIETGAMLKDISLDSTPPEIGHLIYGKVREVTGNSDPFHEIKQKSTQEALAQYDILVDTVGRAEDRLMAGIRVAIAGNVIDFGAGRSVDMAREIRECMGRKFALCDYDVFRDRLEASRAVLYVGDNAGETVFDRVLIEQLGKPVVFAVREAPVINDATYEDAVAAGLDEVATVVSSGTTAPGAILSTCSEEFRDLFAGADMIIAKGQGNYEALSGSSAPVCFLLKAKCDCLARHLGVPVGSYVLKAIGK